MKSEQPVPYEAPTITTYGTVRELTRGTGGTIPDATACATGKSTPSGMTCKGHP
jgi:hypothetical protein